MNSLLPCSNHVKMWNGNGRILLYKLAGEWQKAQTERKLSWLIWIKTITFSNTHAKQTHTQIQTQTHSQAHLHT